mgnify:CR=1 FL=1
MLFVGGLSQRKGLAQLDKALEDIQNWKKMKGFNLMDGEKKVLNALFHME